MLHPCMHGYMAPFHGHHPVLDMPSLSTVVIFAIVITLIRPNVAIFFGGGGGGGGGCGCQQSCAPPPVCAPPPACAPPPVNPCIGGGVVGGGYIPQPGGGSYAVAPGAVGGYGAVPVPVRVPTSYRGGTYVSPGVVAAAKRTSNVPKDTTSYESSDDFRDDTNGFENGSSHPPRDLKVADVSAEAKELEAYDNYKKRYLALKNLRNRRLRQLSAPNVHNDSTIPLTTQPSVCNNDKLAKIMSKSIVNDISVSKRLVRKATELAFDGRKFDVICATGDFSYSIYAEHYCEITRGNVTCFAFI
uniref:Ground-like domain-containing protein n=1 Tax=Panagrellus redivivus TaxID=6233 RepID=A0A7E4VDS1_PANRE